jgi:hypothetical protein
MTDELKRRRVDFERRAAFSPKSVYTHPRRGVRYIPVHHFADEGVTPPEGESVDAWCELPTDVALIESEITKGSKRPAGIWIRRDESSPQFLKVLAVLDQPAVTRSTFEEIIDMVAEHPSAIDGFARIVPGSALTPLSPK